MSNPDVATPHSDPELVRMHAGIKALWPAFQSAPAKHADDMRARVGNYVARCRTSREGPDEALLQPVAALLGSLMQAEDQAEE